MQTYFISDLHLHDARPHCVDAFVRYLAERRSEDRLYILGDLFEAWIGDDFTTPMISRVKSALEQCPAELFMQHGNRDFLIGQEFAQTCGVSLLPEECVIDIAGDRTLLMHGDSLCTKDEAYMKVRPMLRDPNFQSALLEKSIAERLQIATDARSESSEHTQRTDLDIMDVTPAAVIQTMHSHSVKTLIHGHTHRPFDHQNVLPDGTGRRLVLGDWNEYGWHVTTGSTGLILERFTL